LFSTFFKVYKINFFINLQNRTLNLIFRSEPKRSKPFLIRLRRSLRRSTLFRCFLRDVTESRISIFANFCSEFFQTLQKRGIVSWIAEGSSVGEANPNEERFSVPSF
jgi:hypothetical protein